MTIKNKNQKCYTELILSEPLTFLIRNHRLRQKKNKEICLDCGLILTKFTLPRDATPIFSIHEEEKVK